MDQVRIGYTTWQQPDRSIMPKVEYIMQTAQYKEKVFEEADGYVSIEAENYSRQQSEGNIEWTVIPHFGKTLSGITTLPVTSSPENKSVYLEYDMDMKTIGEGNLIILTAPTLNFNSNRGLRYAVSIDGGEEQVVNINGHYKGELGKWQAESIIETSSKFKISTTGRHTIRFRVLDAGIVLQKIMLDMGGLKPSYLGAPQSTSPDPILYFEHKCRNKTAPSDQ